MCAPPTRPRVYARNQTSNTCTYSNIIRAEHETRITSSTPIIVVISSTCALSPPSIDCLLVGPTINITMDNSRWLPYMIMTFYTRVLYSIIYPTRSQSGPRLNIRKYVFSQDLVKSRSHEIGTLNCRIALKFDRHIGSTASEVPVKFQSDRTILNTNLAASRLYEILQKDVFSDIETGPRSLWNKGSNCKHGHFPPWN